MYCLHSPCNQGTSLFYSSVSFCAPSSTPPHLSEWWAAAQQPSRDSAIPHSTAGVMCQHLLLCPSSLPPALYCACSWEEGAIPCLSAEVCASWEGSKYRGFRKMYAEDAGTMPFQVFLMWPHLESFHKKSWRYIPSRMSHPFEQISGRSATCSKEHCLPSGSFQPLSKKKKLDKLGYFWLHLAPPYSNR